MPDTPLVSVYIATHNRADLLSRAIDSVLNQSYKNIEIIVVDDGSIDQTPQRLEQLSIKIDNLKHFRFEEARGACAARNLAIQEASGQFVTGLDDDDEFLPNRIEEFVRNYSPEYSFICSTHYSRIDHQLVPSPLQKREVSLSDFKKKNYCQNLFAERSRVLSIGGYDTTLPAWQDYDFSFRLCEKFGVALKLDNCSYIVDCTAADQRISTSPKTLEGYRMFMEKHGHKLTTAEKDMQLANSLFNRRVSTTFIECFTKVHYNPARYKLFKLYVLTHYPRLYYFLVHTARHWTNFTAKK
ncbi:hypothetical protein BTA51_25535 [Hahella sp. CCB-MM4]|uniref:glycosyltransferase n=1 Tax=Hahella sp. (strain CCB-MM4) TaxID=1926491 RepID=UPI000B9C0355|nr:glycosyltransferase [Hahella sp. CCB-MM4]OZG70499.1 hypothetical protein BTA51_25535 [Hahella sp. CCB-MM4]